MTVCGKSNENSKMNAQSRNFVSSRPSFMITDILSKANQSVDDKTPAMPSSEYLQHLERFSAMNHHGFGLMIPPQMQQPQMQQPPRNQTFCDSDDDDFHGSDDADGQSTDGSNHGKDDDDVNQSNRKNSLPSDRLVHKKQRKARTAFTDHQLHSMEKCFSRQKYLSVQDRMELATKLGISDTQVKTWFQNRRTKWKRQTSVGLELFVEAGNYAAYQRAYASRYGQMDGLPSYPGSALMMPGAGPLMPTSMESYYQQILQNGMAGALQTQHANLFAAAATPHRPLPMVPPMSNAGFLPLSPPTSLYSASRLTNISAVSPQQHQSPEPVRQNSISPVASSPTTHSPKSQPWPNTVQQPTHSASDDDSDIEV